MKLIPIGILLVFIFFQLCIIVHRLDCIIELLK